jgi:hypothetical protein
MLSKNIAEIAEADARATAHVGWNVTGVPGMAIIRLNEP